jgi:rod shape-determining protein MreB
VINESLPIGGDSFDEAIIRYVRRKHNLLIGEITAEEIKTRIGSVMPRRDPLYLDITGRDLLSGLPKTLRITSDEVLEALMEKVAQAARESNAKAEAEKRRRLQIVADEIKEWKRKMAI